MIKATYHIDRIGNPSETELDVDVSINGHEAGNLIEDGANFTIAVDTNAAMRLALTERVQTWLTDNHSYTFTASVDTVEEV